MRNLGQYYTKVFFTGILISSVIAFFIIGTQWLSGRTIIFNSSLVLEFGYYCLYGVVLTLVNTAFFDYVNHRVVWQKHLKYRVILSVLGSIAVTMLGTFFVRLLIDTVFRQVDLAEFLANEQFSYYILSLVVTLIVSLFFHTIYFYKKTQDKKVVEQKIIAGTASAKFESLKNQIDPHFLFNSLNVLSSLIEENPANAQRFTTMLSKVYRYVLEQKDKELISVIDELAFAETYMNLLKMRFENSLFYELPKNTISLEAKVVPLSLQLLLENTVKHNVVSEQKPLRISIEVEGDFLLIQNVLQKKQIFNDRRGVGLQNIIDRYGIVTNRKVIVEETLSTYTVKIPILTKQISFMEANTNIEDGSLAKIHKKVEEIKGFYGNLISYIVVITGLTIINLTSTPSHLWFLYPAFGWGLGVLFHWMKVFNRIPFFGKDWEERKVRELLEREQYKRKY